MSEDIKQKLIGNWKSETKTYENLTITQENYVLGNEKGKWGIQGNEIWLLKENSDAGSKWFFNFEGENRLIFFKPEDFVYRGGTNYIYIQMTPPETEIIFIRVNYALNRGSNI